MIKKYTEESRNYSDTRFRLDEQGHYHSHQPVYGLNEQVDYSEVHHLWRMAKTFQLLRTLFRYKFNSLLDIGAGEGYTASLVKKLTGAKVCVTDISPQPVLRAWQLFGIQGVAVNASRLPFKDDSFDVVICSEAIEHLKDPYEAILEALRVARKLIIFGTCEASGTILSSSLKLLLLPSQSRCGGHRSVWTSADFKIMLGGDIETYTQHLKLPWTMLEPHELLTSVCVPSPPPHLGEGIIALKCIDKSSESRAEIISDELLLQTLLEYRITFKKFEEDVRLDLDDATKLLLRCPRCEADLTFGVNQIICEHCSTRYTQFQGVPDLFEAISSKLGEQLNSNNIIAKSGSHKFNRWLWACLRAKQYDFTECMLKFVRFRVWHDGLAVDYVAPSNFLTRVINRSVQFLEFLAAESTIKAKVLFVVKKPFRLRL